MSAIIEEGFIEEEILNDDEIQGKLLTYINTDTFELVSSDVELEEPFVEVDENIAYVLSTLNKLGYKTEFSCEGHYSHDANAKEFKDQLEKSGYGYIPFEEGYISFVEGITLPFIPENWTNVVADNRIILYAVKPKGNIISESEFLLSKFMSLISLVEWVDALPRYGESEF